MLIVSSLDYCTTDSIWYDIDVKVFSFRLFIGFSVVAFYT